MIKGYLVRDRIAELEARTVAQANTIVEADMRIATLEAALRDLSDHYMAMADGPRSHSLGCQCGASDDGKHSCFTLSEAFAKASALLPKPTELDHDGPA